MPPSVSMDIAADALLNSCAKYIAGYSQPQYISAMIIIAAHCNVWRRHTWSFESIGIFHENTMLFDHISCVWRAKWSILGISSNPSECQVFTIIANRAGPHHSQDEAHENNSRFLLSLLLCSSEFLWVCRNRAHIVGQQPSIFTSAGV